MAHVDDYLKDVAMRKRMVGEIIDDRSLHNLPKTSYCAEYQELFEIETMLQNYKQRKELLAAGKIKKFRVLQGGIIND